MRPKKERFRGQVERTRIKAMVPETDKRDFEEILEKKGLDTTTFLLYKIHLFCEEVESKIEANDLREVPKKRNRDIEKDLTEIQLRLDLQLKDRLDHALKYVPESRNELIRSWIREFAEESKER